MDQNTKTKSKPKPTSTFYNCSHACILLFIMKIVHQYTQNTAPPDNHHSPDVVYCRVRETNTGPSAKPRSLKCLANTVQVGTTELAVDITEPLANRLELCVQHVHLLPAILSLHLLQFLLQLLQLLQQVVVQQHLQPVLLRLQLEKHRQMSSSITQLSPMTS